MINYPRIFERVYLRPVSITRSGFQSIHQVLRPRILGLATMPDKVPDAPVRKPKSSSGRQQNPEPTYGGDGRVIDDRMYSIVGPGVATIGIKGILARNVGPIEAAYCGMAGYEPIQEAAAQLMDANDIIDVVLDIDSPGGECIGNPETAAALQRLAQVKRVVSFTDGLACSAAYFIACAAPAIYLTAGAIAGSIGTKCAVLDDTEALAADGFKVEWFTAGAHKAIGGEGYALTDSDRAELMGEIDYLYGMFAAFVAASRGNIAPLVNKSAGIYVGQQAVDAGLADDVVTGFDEVVQMLLATR